MTGQLDFGSAAPKGDRTFHLDVQDGMGWREIADADTPQELMDEARRQRTAHPGRAIAIRSRDPLHDGFVAGWRGHERITDLPDWIVGGMERPDGPTPW